MSAYPIHAGAVALLLIASGCVFISDDDEKSRLDPDKDGVTWPDDCDDEDPRIGAASTWFVDDDGDGIGVEEGSTSACSQPEGHVAGAGDCDDGDSGIYPGAQETCDGVDEDCSGEVDDGLEFNTWYPDEDGDGFGEDAGAASACLQPPGAVSSGGDCDDADPTVTLASTWYRDADEDGIGDAGSSTEACTQPDGHVEGSGDCDDTNNAVYPGAPETDCSDDTDYNCDGSTGYVDVDGDGQVACEECDDSNEDIYVGATEYCNESDDDCDGRTDEEDAFDAEVWYNDADGDGHGAASGSIRSCERPDGFVRVGNDCDDADSSINPSEDEDCGTDADDDCSGTNNDENADSCIYFYTDEDLDNYGIYPRGCLCEPTTTYPAFADGDCDDVDALVNPGASETCSTSYDDDCDSQTNETGAEACIQWYRDSDRDGFGDASLSNCQCSSTTSYSSPNGEDCDDAAVGTNPAASEVCDDGIDNNCSAGPDVCGAFGVTEVDSADGALLGEASGDHAGTLVALADVSGDGELDLIIAAPDADSSAGAAAAGKVYVTDGLVRGTIGLATLSRSLSSSVSGDHLGQSMDLGDVNGDGYADILVGLPAADDGGANSGAVWLMYGPITSRLTSADVDGLYFGSGIFDRAGASVSLIDSDGDGEAELAVGVPGVASTEPGAVYVVEARSSGELLRGSSEASIAGRSSGDHIGERLTSADLDGDGLEDLTIGASAATPTSGGYGLVSSFFGTLTNHRYIDDADQVIEGDSSSRGFGDLLASCDVDEDGLEDLLVGAYFDSRLYAEQGALYAFGGAGGTIALTDALVTVTGAAFGQRLGASVACGDFDGDGSIDLAVGAPGDTTAGTDSGAVFQIFGPLAGAYDPTDAEGMETGTGANDAVGTSLAAGDVDIDGADDLLIGGEGYDATVSQRGAAWLILGGDQ